MKKILILEASLSQAISIAKFIKKHSEFYVVGVLKEKYFYKLEHYDEIVIKDYKDIDFSKYNYILPTGAESTKFVFEKFNELKYENNFIFKSENLIVSDKTKMLNICKKIGILTPKTYTKTEDIENFPIFYKKKFEYGNSGSIGVANSKQDLPQEDGLLYQEYIDSPCVYGLEFLAKDGNIQTYIMHKEVISQPVCGGSAVVAEKFYDKVLLEKTQKILSYINYSGWGLAEFKYCKNKKEYVFMEINGKFWASIEFGLRNEPQFLKTLFGIEYAKNETKRIIFVNRLLATGFLNTFKNIHFLFVSKILKEHSILRQISIILLPKSIKQIIKKIFYA